MLKSLLLALMSAMVTGDDCGPSCGFVAPTSYTGVDLRCMEAGGQGSATTQINWSDGSYSIVSYLSTVQISVVKYSAYNTGTVTVGKFAGQTATRVTLYTSDNQVCGECQSSSSLGITRVTGDVLLAIGTKGVSPWIECSGNSTYVFSPGLTPPPTPLTYLTVSIDYTDCNTCVESC